MATRPTASGPTHSLIQGKRRPAPGAPGSPTPPPPPPPPPAPPNPWVGLNVLGTADFIGGKKRKNLAYQARPFSPPPGSFGANGWPIYAPGTSGLTRFFNAMDGHYATGNVVFTYEGIGTLTPLGCTLVSSVPGRVVANIVTPDNVGIGYTVEDQDSGDPLRNVAVFYESDEAGLADPWAPDYKTFLQPFKALRFMEAQRINGSTVTDWSSRSLETWWTQTTAQNNKGFPLEWCLDLAQELGRDPWVCIPHLATDDYIHEAAILCLSKLTPGRKVIVEYSNEIWNDLFPQGLEIQALGEVIWPLDQPAIARRKYWSRRSREIFDIFAAEMGGTSSLCRVVASQYGPNTSIGEYVLDFEDLKDHCDAYAVAPYFGGRACRAGSGHPFSVPPTDIDVFLDAVDLEVDVTLAHLAASKAVATNRGLDLFCYESGDAFVPVGAFNTAPFLALLEATRTNPRMQDIYDHYLEGLQAGGVALNCHFGDMQRDASSGCWGSAEYLHPADWSQEFKYQALIAQNA